MADIMQDVLNLNYSPSFDIQGMQEADINLSLSPSVAASATVYGTVTDGTNPLPNATVKLFDSLGVPYRHVMTDVAGAYSFDNIPAGTYSIAAALDGYIMSPSSLLTLSSGSSLEVPLVCRSEAALALGAIAGTATTIGLAGSAPAAGATVTLRNLAGTAVATTRTADDGEFVFYDVADGIYSLVATADGYLATAPIAVTIAEGSIANVAVNMVVDSRTYNGTVSGIIRDSNGAPVSGCFVGLYAVTGLGTSQIETLVATTKTTPRANISSAPSPEGSISSKPSSPPEAGASGAGSGPAFFKSGRNLEVQGDK